MQIHPNTSIKINKITVMLFSNILFDSLLHLTPVVYIWPMLYGQRSQHFITVDYYTVHYVFTNVICSIYTFDQINNLGTDQLLETISSVNQLNLILECD